MRERMESGRGGFTLIEVMVAMAVLILLVVGMTGIFTQATAVSSQGTTSAMRNSVGETAMETLLQDVDGMIVNERLGCYIEADVCDGGQYGFGFDDLWFISTSGDQDDDMPYEYFHFYVEETEATNAMGATYVRFDLHKARMIMAVGDYVGPNRNQPSVYALQKGKTEWWKTLDDKPNNSWDDQILAENVVRFDIYCLGWNGDSWMGQDGSTGDHVFNSTKPHKIKNNWVVSNVPPAAFDIYLQITSPDAAMEGGMALVDSKTSEVARKGREKMIRESASYFGRTVPMTGASQLHHPANHYVD